MRLMSLGRVVVLTACLGTIAFAGPFFAESVHLHLKQTGKGTKIKSITGGWPTHSVKYEMAHDYYTKKHIGNVKFEDITLSLEVGEVDSEVIDWANSFLQGKTDRKSGSVIYLDRAGAEVLRFANGAPNKIVLPGFDSRDETCTDWKIGFSIDDITGTPALMKAKEKANRTKCGSNLRMAFTNNGKETTFDVLETEEVATIILEADLDGDGEYEPLALNVGNVVVYLPAVQAGYFQEWMQRATENPTGEKQTGHLKIRTDKKGSIDAMFGGMQPISVAKMADGSVRVEFCAAEEQLKANPRH